MKECTKCGEIKESTAFAKQRNQCKACRNIYHNLRRKTPEGREKKRYATLRRRHGMSAEEYLEMVDKQENLCAICGSPPGSRALAVDHDHITNKTRELLCVSCNFGIGWFQDNIEIMQKAIEYIKKHAALDADKAPRDTVVIWANSTRKESIMRQPRRLTRRI